MTEGTPMKPQSQSALEPVRGELLAEGKTKEIFSVVGEPTYAIVAYKNTITAFDDPTKTKTFDTKAQHSNTTTSRVFELLNQASIPTSFVRQISTTEFLSERCTMIPLEVVVRRFAFGSFTARRPEFKVEGKEPMRFDEPVVEFFLKTTRGGLTAHDGMILVEGLDPLKGEEDPLIENPHGTAWNLLHPKKKADDPEVSLQRTVMGESVLHGATTESMESIIKQALATLEYFFSKHGFHLLDFKIEFGMTHDGRLVIADVIDNDSWRLRDTEWNDVSKQSFRDGASMDAVADKYALVANLLEKSRP